MTLWLVLQSFTLDKGICLYAKGLCCPDRGGEALVSLLPIWQCTHSVIGAINRPEQPSPVAPQEEAEDFRATDSGVRPEFLPEYCCHWRQTNFTYLFICRSEIGLNICFINSIAYICIFVIHTIYAKWAYSTVLEIFYKQDVKQCSTSQAQHQWAGLCCFQLKIPLWARLEGDLYAVKFQITDARQASLKEMTVWEFLVCFIAVKRNPNCSFVRSWPWGLMPQSTDRKHWT